MKTIVPGYYNEFACIAGACKHSCCEGWEVDIDEYSLARYQAIPEIRRHISEEDVPHFVLQGERCPFLRRDNLCQMILDHGEDMLCQICTDHPRFRNFWTDRVEMGLGLACEEAARIILSEQKPLTLFELGKSGGIPLSEDDCKDLPEDELWLRNVRKDLLQMTHEKRRELYRLIRNRIAQAEVLLMEKENGTTETVFAQNAKAPDFPVLSDALGNSADRLWEYLVYRHIADALYYDDLDERMDFIIWSYRTVLSGWCKSDGSFSAIVEIARDFSNRCEYNTEIMESFGCCK